MRPTLLAALIVSALWPASSRADELALGKRHTAYVELLGKGGLYGVGYELALTPRFHLGAAVSAFQIYGQRVVTASPYVGLYLLRGTRHAWFGQAGPQLVAVSWAPAVPQWDGAQRSGIGGELTSGWEYRNRIVVRAAGSLVAGGGGVTPWLGGSLGVEF